MALTAQQKERALALRREGRGYRAIGKEIGATRDEVHSYLQHQDVDKGEAPAQPDKLLRMIDRKPRSREELTEALCLTPRTLAAALDGLREQGYNIEDESGYIRLAKVVVPAENILRLDWRGDRIIRFGVVSDTHYVSKWQQRTHLRTMYKIFKREGIADVYHPGDLGDGLKMRQGHEYEIFLQASDEHVDYIVNEYPQEEGITTNFVDGNHDLSMYKLAGFDLGRAVAARRPDMRYLGANNAKVFLTPNCVLELNHPSDGSSYAMSYTLQKTIDAMTGGEKPNILLNGHHHKALYLFYRNVHALECGTFQAQTPFMLGKRLAAHVGGWIVEVHVDDEGTINRFKPEFFPFYRMVEHDY